MSEDERPGRSRRRRFYALQRRVAWLDVQLAEKAARGEDDAYLKAERAALCWALDELQVLYPEACRKAREDLLRDER